ncbi:MAG: ORF6N domain-containing protein [Bacteroidales bacterium]|nr:ORF6N domain-containing protein [Bacteroidales bacterium]
MKNHQSNIVAVDINAVKSRMLQIRGQQVLLDRDVAALYGVETKEVNQAVKRNVERFYDGYILTLTSEECSRSQIVTLNGKRGSNIKYLPHAFTEKGLYMLATVLKSKRAIQATHAIIETYAQVRTMVRDMEALQSLKDGSVEQASKLSQAGHKLASLIGDNLSTDSAKTTIELNLAVLKITHEVTRTKAERN